MKWRARPHALIQSHAPLPVHSRLPMDARSSGAPAGDVPSALFCYIASSVDVDLESAPPQATPVTVNISSEACIPTEAHVPDEPASAAAPVSEPPIDYDFDAQTKTKRIKAQLLELIESKEHFFSRSDKENFGFLNETADLVLAYLAQQTDLVKNRVPEYRVLMKAFVNTLDETLGTLLRIARRETVVTDSFEIFELSIRRYLEQFKRMYPPNAVISPLAIIEDLEARAVWEKNFGRDAHYVSFAQFQKHIIDIEFIEVKDKILNWFRLFLNFPQDDLITTYKWNNITRLFGPYPNFVKNFASVALGKGFLGLINRVRARDILTMDSAANIYLIRFSRTMPEFLAFSYKGAGGQIGHFVNAEANGDIIPVRTFIARKFPAFEPVNLAVNAEAVVSTRTIGSYSAGFSGGYIVT